MEMQDKAKELKKTSDFHELKKFQVSSRSSRTEMQDEAKELEKTANSDGVKKPRVTPVFNASDIRTQKPGDRIALLADLRRSLAKLEPDNSGRAKAKKGSIMHKIAILSK